MSYYYRALTLFFVFLFFHFFHYASAFRIASLCLATGFLLLSLYFPQSPSLHRCITSRNPHTLSSYSCLSYYSNGDHHQPLGSVQSPERFGLTRRVQARRGVTSHVTVILCHQIAPPLHAAFVIPPPRRRPTWQVLSPMRYWDANTILLLSVDYSVFAIPDFDPNEYANALLAGEPYPFPTASSSVSPSLEVSAAPGTRNQGHGPTLLSTQPQAGRKRLGVDTVSILEPAREDISIAISKLDVGIEDVNKQIKALVWRASNRDDVH